MSEFTPGANPPWASSLFRSALVDSFPGTLADQTVGTPAGPQAAQVPPPMPIIPRPTTSPRDPAVAKRLQSVQGELDQTLALADQIRNLPSPTPVSGLGLLLGRALDPDYNIHQQYRAARAKVGMLDQTLGRASELLQEMRLLEAPSPFEAKVQEEMAKQYGDQIERARRQGILQVLQRYTDIPPAVAENFVETGQGLLNDQLNPIAQVTASGKAGEMGLAPNLQAAGVSPNLVSAARNALAEKQRGEAVAHPEQASKGKFAGLDTAEQLHSALDKATADYLDAPEYSKWEQIPTGNTNPATGPLYSIHKTPTITLQQARQLALQQYPGADKVFPKYMLEPPKPAVGPQTGLSNIAIDSALNKVNARIKAAGPD